MPEPAHPEQPPGGEAAEHAWGTRPLLPRLQLPATVDTVPGGPRVTVIVRGELDLDTCQQLRPDLLRALSGSVQGIDLHLREVAFCDCSGTNLMLELRRLALQHGKSVTVLSSSPAVDRVFALTAIRNLFEPTESPDDKPCDGLDHEFDHEACIPPQPGPTPPEHPGAVQTPSPTATATPPAPPPGVT
ncbi:STAS domain-containing protein [Streptomyces sp. NPDC050439]|uniref:STAS domain-containing protein n=1 Tax=unclassified Streptomyces TaxID=2593676 RepID=UPI003448024F